MPDWALHGFGQRGLRVYIALFALLALAIAGLLVRGGSPSVSSEVRSDASAPTSTISEERWRPVFVCCPRRFLRWNRCTYPRRSLN